MNARLWFLLILSAGVGILVPRKARADVQECLDASERGQRARAAGSFREAHDNFLLCRNDSCPALVRRDCAQWHAEVTLELPSVVFGARSKSGSDLFDVTVLMDGKPLLDRLDGRAVAVDPGPHTFTFGTRGSPPVVVRALIKQGEKARAIGVAFEDTDAGSSLGPKPNPSSGSLRSESIRTGDGAAPAPSGHTVLPWVLASVGVAALATGLVIVLTTPARPEGCDEARKVCTSVANESTADFEKRQNDAGRSDAQPVLGLVVGGIGLGAIAGGLLWHFLEPSPTLTTPNRSTRLHLTPWLAGPRQAGAALELMF